MKTPKQPTSILAITTRRVGEGVKALTEAATGVASTNPQERAKSIGFLLQRVRSGQFLETLNSEWQRYRDAGRVEEEYPNTDQHAECLQELLDFLDKDSPDRLRFEAMKHIFLNAASETMSTRESVLPQQYMRICRNLNSGELLVLRTIYGEFQAGRSPGANPETPNSVSAKEWARAIALASPLRHTELIFIHEKTLMEKRIITSRVHNDSSGINPKSERLTELGQELCRFMEEHELPPEKKKKKAPRRKSDSRDAGR